MTWSDHRTEERQRSYTRLYDGADCLPGDRYVHHDRLTSVNYRLRGMEDYIWRINKRIEEWNAVNGTCLCCGNSDEARDDMWEGHTWDCAHYHSMKWERKRFCAVDQARVADDEKAISIRFGDIEEYVHVCDRHYTVMREWFEALPKDERRNEWRAYYFHQLSWDQTRKVIDRFTAREAESVTDSAP